MKYLNPALKTKYLPSLLVPITLAITGCGGSSDPGVVLPQLETDTIAPTVTVVGDANVTIFQNTEYVDQGATATDDIDGSVSVDTAGSVNESIVGEYVITYYAEDMAGNEGTATRTVTVSAATLSGTAAGGAAIVGTVVVKGANGNVKSALIEADGTYEVDVTGLTAPYRLRAEGTVGGKSYKLHSYAETASVGNTVNITPFTDLIIANTANQLAANFFDSDNETNLDPEELDAQEDALQAKLQHVFDELGLDTAIDLLNSSFSADHSGVDAALDLISIETGENNIATITNLLDGSSIEDDITDTEDNSEVITVEAGAVTVAVTDTVAIANIFSTFTSHFSDGLPDQEDIQPLFGDDFLSEDEPLSLFFTDILTDPDMIGISFVSLSVNDLDSAAGTAMVSFNVAFNDVVDAEPEQWFVAKHETLGWQLLGDQQIVDLNDLSYHCNDYDGLDNNTGGCGINTSFEDEDFTNNGTGDEPILSATVSITSPDGVVKGMFYMGTPDYSSEGQIYNEGEESYTGDWREFGTGTGQIDPSIFSVGDSVEYQFYEANLDLGDPSAPVVIGDPIATYAIPVNFAPQSTGKYPTATSESIVNLENFSFDEDTTIEWTLAEGTRSDEVYIQINNANGNYIYGTWDELNEQTITSYTFDSTRFDAELLASDNFNPDDGFSIEIRIYAADITTGQYHSTSYRQYVSADTGGNTGGNTGSNIPFTVEDVINATFFNTYADEDQNDYWVLEQIVFDATGNGHTLDGAPGTYEIIDGVLVLSQNSGDTEYIGLLERLSDDHWTTCWGDSVATAYDCDGLGIEHSFTTEEASIAYAEQQNGALTCGYESGWENEAPVNPNSFADFIAVVDSCASQIITKAMVANTVWTGNDDGGSFNDDGSATVNDPSTGFFVEGDETYDFTWYIEVVDGHYLLVVHGDYGVDGWFRETRAITNTTTDNSGTVYEVTHYYEDGNFSDDTRATGDDAEIWNTDYTIGAAQ